MFTKSYFAKALCFAMLLLVGSSIMAQTRITGKITNQADNKPLVGATVQEKGTTNATQTGSDGSFAITAASNGTLVVSIVGFGTQEIGINGRSDISVAMQTTIGGLDEVVVVGYGTQRRKDVTGAISSVSAAQIEKVPITTAQQALQGRAAGVQIINNDASPGSNISVLIRGVGSLASGGNNPLYVVDGYPTTGGINNINPNDIASIDVLKDASATAIYGIRAANGVVIITTKKGTKNKMQVSLDAFVSTQSEPKKYDLLNAQEFATLSNEVEAADLTN